MCDLKCFENVSMSSGNKQWEESCVKLELAARPWAPVSFLINLHTRLQTVRRRVLPLRMSAREDILPCFDNSIFGTKKENFN